MSQSVQEKLDAYCKAAEATGRFHGTVLIKQKGNTLLSASYGYADVEARKPGDVNTVYQIGSITKQFTATVILKLAEQGKLSLDDKLSKYYPSFPKGDKVTIEQMLSHRSGIKSYTGLPNFDSIKTRRATEDGMVKLFASQPYEFEPGTAWGYSNSAYSLLGYIIQKVTRKPYEQVVREMILQPLGMRQGGFDYAGLKVPKAKGYYQVEKDTALQAAVVDSTVAYAAGSLCLTPAELSTWNQALFSGKVISPASVKNAHTIRSNSYGLGWFVDSFHQRQVIHHGGGIDGFTTMNFVVPGEQLEIIVFENVSTYDPGSMSVDLLGIVLGKDVALPKKLEGVQVNQEILARYAGDYELEPGKVATVLVKDGKLMVDTHHDPVTELLAKSETVFGFSFMDATVEFVSNSSGKVEKFVFSQGGQKMEAKKIK